MVNLSLPLAELKQIQIVEQRWKGRNKQRPGRLAAALVGARSRLLQFPYVRRRQHQSHHIRLPVDAELRMQVSDMPTYRALAAAGGRCDLPDGEA